MAKKRKDPDDVRHELEVTDDDHDHDSEQKKWDDCLSEIHEWDTSFIKSNSRIEGICEVLKKEGGFCKSNLFFILIGYDDATGVHNEEIALWLREKLSRLRREEKKTSKAPVLSGSSIGRTMISDIAFTLLQCRDEPGPNLLVLFAKLLDVDRHRKALAEIKSDEKDKAVHLDARQPGIGVRTLAKRLGVAPSTVTAWRSDPDYQKKIVSIRRAYNSEEGRKFRKLIAEHRKSAEKKSSK